MKTSDFLSGLNHFFNDFVGTVIPGLVLMIGLISLDLEVLENIVSNQYLAAYGWLFMLVLAYSLGHLILSLSDQLQKIDFYGSPEIDDKRASYKEFQDFVNKQYAIEKGRCFSQHELRSLAMSFSAEGSEIGRRFMFIALACYGVATSLLVLFVIYIFMCFQHANFTLAFWLVTSLTIFSYVLLIKRGNFFKKMALNTPFSIALEPIYTLSKAGFSE